MNAKLRDSRGMGYRKSMGSLPDEKQTIEKEAGVEEFTIHFFYNQELVTKQLNPDRER